jgi:hypothetical protein
MSVPLAEITHETFSGMENETFTFHLGGEAPAEATLVEVKHLGTRAVTGAIRDPFALLFQLPAGVARGCGVFPVEHPKLGRIELHMTAVVPDEDSSYFEIMFD